MLVGGASILLGIKLKLGAAAIIRFLAGVSPILHDFWHMEGSPPANDMINFSRNMASLGGATAPMGVQELGPPASRSASQAPGTGTGLLICLPDFFLACQP